MSHISQETSKKCRNLVKNEENKELKCTQRGIRESKVLWIVRINECQRCGGVGKMRSS